MGGTVTIRKGVDTGQADWGKEEGASIWNRFGERGKRDTRVEHSGRGECSWRPEKGERNWERRCDSITEI